MRKKNMVTGPLVGLISSVLAFLGMISVCGFPLIAAFLAWFGIGASQLSFLSEYQSLFMVIAVIALLYGFYSIYFKKDKGSNSSNCSKPQREERCCESKSKSNYLSKIMLWIAACAIVGTYFIDAPENNGKLINQSCKPASSTDEIRSLSFPCTSDTAINKTECPR